LIKGNFFLQESREKFPLPTLNFLIGKENLGINRRVVKMQRDLLLSLAIHRKMLTNILGLK
jgi:hypothetical protein